MLKELLKQTSKGETHIYMSVINEATKEARERIKAHQLEASERGDYEVAIAYSIAWGELAFLDKEIIEKQIKTLCDE
tara:strand:+ start:8475 stop:8705 length:231 start_codon:yes stop_codon:yes gene_type:complete